MTTKILSRKATLAYGALLAYLAPKIAQDAKVDLSPALDGVTAENFNERKAAVVDGVKAAVDGKLAKDASLEDLGGLIDAIGAHKGGGEEKEKEEGEDAGGGNDALCEFLKTKLSPEDYAQVENLLGAGGAAYDNANPKLQPNAGGKPGQPHAMDQAAVEAVVKEATDKAAKQATDAARKEQRAIREAERAVRPYVGELAMDAAETSSDVYRAAFKALGVDVKDVHESAFPALLKAQKPAKTTVAQDGDPGASKSYSDRFPESARLGV